MSTAGPRPLSRRAGVAIAVITILALYGMEAHVRREIVATPAMHSDQAAYLAYAQQMRESSYSFAGTRNRMPVFPFLLSLIYRAGMDETEFLRRAQTFNVNLSILLLGLLFLIFRKFFFDLHALALLVITAFGVFVYRAGIVQAELLYYFLSFCAFVCLLRMFSAPNWWLAILSGFALGLAYLTKASMLPALPIWATLFAAQAILLSRTSSASRRREIWQRGWLGVLVIAVFLVVVFPYIRTSKRIYGQYFYNVNSAFYMWCDSWPQAVAFSQIYNDPNRRQSLAPDQIPSAANYWRQHSIAQIAQRLGNGFALMFVRGAKAIGHFKYVLVLAIAAAAVTAWRRGRALTFVADHAFATIFCGAFFLVYVLLYAWYYPVVTDNRFILSLFVPFVFAASIYLLGLMGEMRVRRIEVSKLYGGVLIALALIDAGYNAMRVFS